MKNYKDCANDYELWSEYVDPDNTVSEDEFNEMTEEEKIRIQIDCFGKENTMEKWLNDHKGGADNG